jgi:hypothetical protein
MTCPTFLHVGESLVSAFAGATVHYTYFFPMEGIIFVLTMECNASTPMWMDVETSMECNASTPMWMDVETS